ncbi:MAG: hypothetical protein GF317_07355 [Candidatus Lokiarchaeota archaeon]|nr:hypothetical protein [Candidatus Lokiarchaeota archaeon]MBD3199525.1 hypothetical protein [Candidatus Lokiarchaeota archaeon]
MLERLYQPDFSCIFGEKFANAFLYPQIDSLVWPIFESKGKSEKLKRLLNLKNKQNHPYFYRRKITLEDFKVEINCAQIESVYLQAMNLGRDYGIENEDAIRIAKIDPSLFKVILSFDLSEDQKAETIISKVIEYQQCCNIIGFAIYPAYSNLNLNDKNPNLRNILDYAKENNLIMKIDLCNSYFQDYHDNILTQEAIHSFISKYPENIFILSGLDISGDIEIFYQLLKYFNNIWIEIDPRTFGGMTPKDCFLKLFKLKGFIQNSWHRLLIGSASPTLEISQIVRGFWEATENLSFAEKCLLRTWAFRNGNRLNLNIAKKDLKTNFSLFNPLISIQEEKAIKTQNETICRYKLKLRSYSITQLIFLTDIIKDLLKDTISRENTNKNGEVFIRSYHTTTSLIVNEHEYGNYLDLHYKFAEISREDCGENFHTVRALENRADFNRLDHDLATTYGNRQLILPVIDGKLDIGGRENYYIMVTFGPRSFSIFINVKLYNEI